MHKAAKKEKPKFWSTVQNFGFSFSLSIAQDSA